MLGSFLRSAIFPAPKFCDTMAEIALRVCPSIQMSAERKVPTIPTAARDSVPNSAMLPTIAASVLDKTGSAIPAMIAGIASCWILPNEMLVVALLKLQN